MARSTSPVVAAWELALRLRQRRDQFGVDVKTITETLGFSRNYWSAVENERKILSEESLIKLLRLLEFDEEEQRELLELRAAAKERGWWTSYSGLIHGDVQRMYGLESGALSIRGYENLLIPGLLQTPEYYRAMLTRDVTIRTVEIEQRIEVRLRRQERLSSKHPPHLTVILSEAALYQQIGGPQVLRDQLQHLVNTIEKHPDTIEVLVIPFTATACALFGASSIHIVDFENSRLPAVIWHETVSSWDLLENSAQARDIIVAYEDALQRTLSTQETLRLIRRRTKELA